MKELKFIHITKCAGTYVEEMGKKHNIFWGRYHIEYGYWHKIFPRVKKELKDKYDWFMVVRNPYDRILSEYYCQWGGVGDKNKNNKNNKKKKKQKIFHTKRQFNDFLIDRIIHRQYDNYHYVEQYKYIDPKCKIHVVKFENLKEDLTTLFKKYNLQITLVDKKINNKESRYKNLPFTVNDFSNDLIKLINSVYYQDFKIFNYPFLNHS